MLELDPLNVLGVSKFEDRLEEAMALAGKSAKELATVLISQKTGTLGPSVQAVYAALKGRSKSMTAENVARAARFLGVDMFWLATGVGSAKERVGQSLDPDQLYVIERMSKLSRYHIEMLTIAVDAFSGPFADRATMSIAYAPRALQPSQALAANQEKLAD